MIDLRARRAPHVEGPRWWRAALSESGSRLIVERGATWTRFTASGIELKGGRDEAILALSIGQKVIVCGRTIAETSALEIVDTLPAYLVKLVGKDPVRDGVVFVTPVRRKGDR